MCHLTNWPPSKKNTSGHYHFVTICFIYENIFFHLNSLFDYFSQKFFFFSISQNCLKTWKRHVGVCKLFFVIVTHVPFLLLAIVYVYIFEFNVNNINKKIAEHWEKVLSHAFAFRKCFRSIKMTSCNNLQNTLCLFLFLFLFSQVIYVYVSSLFFFLFLFFQVFYVYVSSLFFFLFPFFSRSFTFMVYLCFTFG
jgi:hypothetical protein